MSALVPKRRSRRCSGPAPSGDDVHATRGSDVQARPVEALLQRGEAARGLPGLREPLGSPGSSVPLVTTGASVAGAEAAGPRWREPPKQRGEVAAEGGGDQAQRLVEPTRPLLMLPIFLTMFLPLVLLLM